MMWGRVTGSEPIKKMPTRQLSNVNGRRNRCPRSSFWPGTKRNNLQICSNKFHAEHRESSAEPKIFAPATSQASGKCMQSPWTRQHEMGMKHHSVQDGEGPTAVEKRGGGNKELEQNIAVF